MDIFDDLVVVKRSGQRVDFNGYKIAVAIKNAFDSFENDYKNDDINKVYEEVINQIIKEYKERKTINVEDIQDMIAGVLNNKKYSKVYEAFTMYRQKRAESRAAFTIKQQHKFAKAMEKIADDNLLRSDNNYKPWEIISNYGKIVAKEYAKSYIIDNKYLRAHEEGSIYIHDLDTFYLGMFCDTNLKLNDFFNSNDSINKFASYLIECKKEINGEICISSIEKVLTPYLISRFKQIFKDRLKSYVKVCGFYEYLNLGKVNELIDKEELLPFNLSKYEQYFMTNTALNILHSSYDDSLNDLRFLTYKKLERLLSRLEESQKKYSISFGTVRDLISTFIKDAIIRNLNEKDRLQYVTAIYKIKDLNDDYLDLIANLVSDNKNIVLSFVKDTDNIEYFASGKRLYDNYNDDNYSLGRMVIATTSINVARLGLNYEGKSEKELFNKFSELLDLVKNELLLSFEFIGNKTIDNYKMLFRGNIETDEKLENAGGKIRKVIKNGTLNIGLVGLKECVKVFYKDDNEKQIKFLKKIIKFAKDKCFEFSKETKLNFYIMEPYKAKCQKEFIRLDASVYGKRKGITDKYEYDLVANYSDDYRINCEIQKMFNAGAMIEVKINNKTSHKKIMDIVNTLYECDAMAVRFVTEEK